MKAVDRTCVGADEYAGSGCRQDVEVSDNHRHDFGGRIRYRQAIHSTAVENTLARWAAPEPTATTALV